MDRLRSRLRQFNRFRWIEKSRIVREGGGLADFPTRAHFVFLQPTDTHTYDLLEPGVLASDVAALFNVPDKVVLDYFEELRTDRGLLSEIAGRSRGHFNSKAFRPLGRWMIAYAALRIRRPALAVEVGTHHGRGTAVLLRALERNGSQGHAGTLITVDIDPDAGFLVGKEKLNIERVIGASPGAVASATAGRPVGFLLSDSTPDPAMVSAEYEAALANMDAPLVLMQNGAWNTCLLDITEREGGRSTVLVERGRNHVIWGREVHLGIIGTGASPIKEAVRDAAP